MNYSKNFEVSDFSNSQFLVKMQSSFANCQNALQIANCEQLILNFDRMFQIKMKETSVPNVS